MRRSSRSRQSNNPQLDPLARAYADADAWRFDSNEQSLTQRAPYPSVDRSNWASAAERLGARPGAHAHGPMRSSANDEKTVFGATRDFFVAGKVPVNWQYREPKNVTLQARDQPSLAHALEKEGLSWVGADAVSSSDTNNPIKLERDRAGMGRKDTGMRADLGGLPGLYERLEESWKGSKDKCEQPRMSISFRKFLAETSEGEEEERETSQHKEGITVRGPPSEERLVQLGNNTGGDELRLIHKFGCANGNERKMAATLAGRRSRSCEPQWRRTSRAETGPGPSILVQPTTAESQIVLQSDLQKQNHLDVCKVTKASKKNVAKEQFPNLGASVKDNTANASINHKKRHTTTLNVGIVSFNPHVHHLANGNNNLNTYLSRADGSVVEVKELTSTNSIASESVFNSMENARRRAFVLRNAKAIVRVLVTICKPNYALPWLMNRPEQGVSSGFVIQGQRILTTSTAIENHTQIMVQKGHEERKYVANVDAVGKDCGLALLSVHEDDFWIDTHPLSLGTIPHLNDEIFVIGFSAFENNICSTNVKVSNLDGNDLGFGGLHLIGVNISSAFRPDILTGPALNHDNQVVGMAFQVDDDPRYRDHGYLISMNVIKHFLEDISKNGRYIGFCHHGFTWQKMENESLRRYMALRNGETGVLVRKISPQSNAASSLKPNDVITAIDGINISNDGTILYRLHDRLSFHHIIACKFSGDKVKLTIFREGVRMDLEYIVQQKRNIQLVPIFERHEPEYVTIGGLVFINLSEPYLQVEFGTDWQTHAPIRLLDSLMYSDKDDSDRQVVLLSHVMEAKVNAGYDHLSNERVKKVNGTPVKNVAHLAQLLRKCAEEYLTFELDDEIIILDRMEAVRAEQEICRKYRVPAAARVAVEKQPEN